VLICVHLWLKVSDLDRKGFGQQTAKTGRHFFPAWATNIDSGEGHMISHDLDFRIGSDFGK
jgi:hypothetical protein